MPQINALDVFHLATEAERHARVSRELMSALINKQNEKRATGGKRLVTIHGNPPPNDLAAIAGSIEPPTNIDAEINNLVDRLTKACVMVANAGTAMAQMFVDPQATTHNGNAHG